MKTTFLIALLFCANHLFAQTSLYTETKVFNEGGYSYQCDVSSVGNVTLYNSAKHWIGIDQKVKETNKPFMFEDFFVDFITDESWLRNRDKVKKIMLDAISELDAKTLRKKGELYVNFFINSETGRIDDVRFYFDRDSCYVYLPVSFFRQLELTFKEKCQYVITDFAKTLNYVYQWDTFKL